MTLGLEFDEIEAEPVPASHLMRAQCRGCGVATLADAGHVTDARCGPCMLVRAAELAEGRGVAEYTTPVGYPMGARPEVREVRSGHPAPVLVERWRGEPFEEAPVVVGKLAEYAMEAGWEVRWSHAIGTGVHGSTGRPTSLQERYSLSFGLHPAIEGQAVAVYREGWGSMWCWSPKQPHFGLPSLADLKAWLAGECDLDTVRARVAAAVEAETEQVAARKFIKGLRSGGMSVEEICTALGVELEVGEVRALFARKGKEGAS